MTTRRFFGLVLCAALLAGCLPEIPQKNPYLLEPPPPPSGIRRIPHTFALSMLSGRKAKRVSLRVYNTGYVRTRGEGVSALKSYHAKIKLDIPVFAVIHSSRGAVLFDTGLSPERDRRPGGILDVVSRYKFRYKRKRRQDIVSQLRADGIDPDDVRWVIASHLDRDAAGMIDAFPNAEVVVSRMEWEWRADRTREGLEPSLLSPQWLKPRVREKLVDLHNAPALGAFENGLDLFEDGSVYLVSLPGHTPGNMGAWINLDKGPVLLTGGATFVVDNYLDLSLPVKGKIDDLEDYWRSLHIIRAMRKAVPNVIIFPGNQINSLAVPIRGDLSLRGKWAKGS